MEQLCDFSGDALLNLRAVFAKQFKEVVSCFQTSECSLRSGWRGETGRQLCGILRHISNSSQFSGKEGKFGTRFSRVFLSSELLVQNVGCISLRCTCARLGHMTVRFNPHDAVVLHRRSRKIVGVRPRDNSSNVREDVSSTTFHIRYPTAPQIVFELSFRRPEQ